MREVGGETLLQVDDAYPELRSESYIYGNTTAFGISDLRPS
jgi:hypothetical protein